MIRVPRMHAFPWQTAELTLMRSFQFSIHSMVSRLSERGHADVSITPDKSGSRLKSGMALGRITRAAELHGAGGGSPFSSEEWSTHPLADITPASNQRYSLVILLSEQH